MLVINPAAFSRLMQALVEATHGMSKLDGKLMVLGTVSEDTLRRAALAALVQVTGEVVWPGDRELALPRPDPAPSVIRFK